MNKRIFTEDLFPLKDNEEIVELLYGKKKKLFLNFSLMFIYTALLIASLFVI